MAASLLENITDESARSEDERLARNAAAEPIRYVALFLELQTFLNFRHP